MHFELLKFNLFDERNNNKKCILKRYKKLALIIRLRSKKKKNCGLIFYK